MNFASKSDIQFLISKIKQALTGKVDTESGKGLSTNDYTDDEKTKLAGISKGANAYTHPSYTAHDAGLYKVGIDATGHVSQATAVTKADITSLGIPAQDTTYSPASSSSAGLMSAADKSKLDSSPTTASVKSQIEAYGYQNASQVQSAVNTAVGKITTISYSVVTSLPSTGTAGTIYLIADSHSDAKDVYDEYIWVEATKSFEKLGNTDVDLSGYLKAADVSEICTTEMTTMWNA